MREWCQENEMDMYYCISNKNIPKLMRHWQSHERQLLAVLVGLAVKENYEILPSVAKIANHRLLTVLHGRLKHSVNGKGFFGKPDTSLTNQELPSLLQKPENRSLLCLQESATEHYPESDQSSPRSRVLLL
jgi:hypothetical protein